MGLAVRVIRFSTETARAASPCWPGNVRARSPGPIRCLYRPMAVSIVGTQTTKRFALAVGTGWDGVADLDRTVDDDHAVHQQLEQRPLLAEVCVRQAFAHAVTERLGIGGQAGRLALSLGIVRELMETMQDRGKLAWSG